MKRKRSIDHESIGSLSKRQRIGRSPPLRQRCPKQQISNQRRHNVYRKSGGDLYRSENALSSNKLPHSVRILTDKRHFAMRHDDTSLPARRNNRPPPRERQLAATGGENVGINVKDTDPDTAMATEASTDQQSLTSLPSSPVPPTLSADNKYASIIQASSLTQDAPWACRPHSLTIAPMLDDLSECLRLIHSRLDSLSQSFDQVVSPVTEPQGTPGPHDGNIANDFDNLTPQMVTKDDILLLQSSIRSYTRHALKIPHGILPINWPKDVAAMIDERGTVLAKSLARRYIDDHSKGSYISHIPYIHPALMTYGQLEISFVNHIKYLRKARASPRSASMSQKKRRSQRRRHKFVRRQNALASCQSVAPYPNILEDMGTAGMSAEESTCDEDGDYIRVLLPAWRSNELNQYLNDLDVTSGFQRRGRVAIEIVYDARKPYNVYANLKRPTKFVEDD
ncbi:hypothetical protein M408DRAFT_317075 [Serendipita vermifera MAFF 305830]|uniref:Uncharacterized protein n=1 Tax=Serendipita vermifera MAFF 305830 TaxID=933852 RepID=A0A0C3AJJ6_SERVB|nr:hypothetical protein M408DRAFT_317075 [Serendipita vermifera MAFF 305830]